MITDKVLIIGATGMLGHKVANFFKNITYTVTTSRKLGEADIFYDVVEDSKNGFLNLRDILHKLDVDYVINCVGAIKPTIGKIPNEYVFIINSIFPRILADVCEILDKKLIHITTDCVFTGFKGLPYDETDIHDITDIYGLSKSFGEPTNCMVIRTSIVGEELYNNYSLIEWAKSQKNKEVNGFTNHLWNGITTLEFAKICFTIIKDNMYKKTLKHVYSNDVSKYDMLEVFNRKWNLNMKINPVEASQSVDRRLTTIDKEFLSKLNILSFEKMIYEL